MRRVALLVVTVAACGRFGYDATTDAATVDTDAGPDALDAPPAGQFMTCDQPVQLADVGDTGGASASFFAMDVASTTTGFVLAWQTSNGSTHTTGVALARDAAGPYLDVRQPDTGVTSKEGPMAITAIGDDVLLGVDDMFDSGMKLIPLDAMGLERASIEHTGPARAFGHDYLVADPARNKFVVMSGNAADSEARIADLDGVPEAGPAPIFTSVPESLAVRPFGAGYVAITGNGSNCDVATTDAALAVNATSRQAISMTCHNASLVVAPGGTSVVASWNCEDDMVWATGGPPDTMLPPHHAVFGDAANSSSNPRLAVTSAGVWYVFRVAPDRVGRALLGPDSQPMPSTTPGILFTRPELKAHDLATHEDDAFLFWLEVSAAGNTSLWSQRLCTP